MHLDALSTVRAALAGRYAVEEEIGRGGMAFVWRARDLRHDRIVAIKILFPELARAVGGERFLREIGILARLSHPHILPLLDSGAVEIMPGLLVPWYVMPFVAEETLRARLKREGPLPVPVALRYTRELCSALAHAHAQGYIHRDIKPENILLQSDQAVLADFGIARAVTVASGTALSSTGLVVGTPAYMSPEQSLGSDRLDARSDFYSLGVVLYEMLAGHPPFSGATPQAISARHQFETPPPIGVVRPGLPSGVEAVVARALAKVPADRFQKAEEFALAAGHAPETGAQAPMRATGRRLWRTTATVAVVAVTVAGAAFGLPWWAGPSVDPERVVVLPFQHVGDVTPALIRGGDCMTLVYDALGRWPDLPQVDGLRVQSALAASGTPQTLGQGERIARSLGAGRLIWGQLYLAGDSLRVRAFLYQVGRFGSRTVAEYAIGLPRSLQVAHGDLGLSQQVVGGFIRLARHLMASGGVGGAALDESLETSSWDALRAKLSGDSALQAWDLSLARTRYREAASLDIGYPQANLSLAQLGMWAGDDRAEWRGRAATALQGQDRLLPQQQQLARALVAFAEARYPEACGMFRDMAGRDSTSFSAWFGLGECLARDEGLVSDLKSPSGLAFRSSYQAALDAYGRALELIPLAYASYAGTAISRLLDRYFAEPNTLRWGRFSEGDRDTVDYAAFPDLDHDTLAFYPRPAGEVLAGSWAAERNTAANAIGRRRLREVTVAWVRAFPQSASAWRAHAIALELAGSLSEGSTIEASAVQAIRRARSLPAGPHEALDLAVANVRILTKLTRYDQAAALADSLLDRVIPELPEESAWLAGLAALLGRTNQAAQLLGASAGVATFATPDGGDLAVSEPTGKQALRLLAYAAFGAPRESLMATAQRLDTMLMAQPAEMQSSRLRVALLDRPTLLAFPLLGVPSGSGSFRLAERRIAAGDTVGARAALDSLAAHKRGLRPGDFAADMTLLEARLWLAIGDSSEARTLVAGALRNLDGFGRDLVTEVPQAAAVGRLMLLADSIRGPGEGEGYRRATRELWRPR